MDQGLKLSFPRCVHIGPGAVRHLGEKAARLGQRVLLMTGRRALRKSGTLDRLLALMGDAGISVEVFDEVPPEPDLATVDRARERLRRADCDVVIGLGGGSALDVGKAAAALAVADGPTAVYHAGAEVPTRGLPHVAVPTTAGTGSEATSNSVLIDADGMVKKSLRGPTLLPDVCIVDAELTLSCPPSVTAASGMDALVQAIESYVSVQAVATTEALSLEAARAIGRSLPVAYEDGAGLPARAAMVEASFMAGLALGSARLGAVHGLAHPVGMRYGLPHGVVCGVLAPHVFRRNAPAVGEKYARLAEAMGGDPADRTESLLDRLALPRSVGPYPDAEGERTIMEYALSSGSSCANPVMVDEAYVRGILKEVCT